MDSEPPRRLLVDLRVLEHRVDALAAAALEHAAGLRASRTRARMPTTPYAAPRPRRRRHGARRPSGSAISTSRASTSSRSRRATRARSGSSSSSDASASPISFSDSSCRSQRVDDSYRRAFSIATAAWAASSCVSSSSSSVKSSPPSFSVRYRFPYATPRRTIGTPRKVCHRRVVAREADRARIVREVVQSQRPGFADQDAEDAAPARKVTDRRVRLRVDPGGQEALERLPGPVDHPERRVPGAGQLAPPSRRSAAGARRARAPRSARCRRRRGRAGGRVRSAGSSVR